MSIDRCDDIEKLNPIVKELALKLLEEAKKEGMAVKIIDTFRSVERQDYLYSLGRTRPGNIVTYAKGSDMSSYHMWGLAFDCIQNIQGKEYDNAFLTKLGKIGQSIGLEWGGGWSGFRDAPHFQCTFGLSIDDLKSGEEPPTVKSYTVKIQPLNISLNGEIKQVDAVMLDGFNYIKLRDISDDRISVGYDYVEGHTYKMPIINLI